MGELCADSSTCCAKAWLEHHRQHRECLESCPVLNCLAQCENLVCNQTLHHNISHLGEVPEPDKFLALLLSRSWLPTAFPGALTAVWRCTTSNHQQLFSIAGATKTILTAVPESTWTAQSLVSTLQLAAIPSNTFDHGDQLAALQLLLDAKQGSWTPGELTPVLKACCESLEASSASLANSKQYQILDLLFNCCAPHPCAAVDDSGLAHTPIDHCILQAISYGVAPTILELLLSKAPHWHPDSLQERGPNTPVNNGQTVPAFPWIRSCPDYIGHYPVIIQAAAERQVTAALVPHLLYLAQPFGGSALAQPNSSGIYERLVLFIRCLLQQQGGIGGRSETTNALFTAAANHRNVVLLTALAECQVRYPKAILQPLVVIFAAGTADCDAGTVRCLLAMADEPWMDNELMQGLIVAAEGSHNQVTKVTFKMVDALCSPHSWNNMLALAAQCKLTRVHQLLLALNFANGQTLQEVQKLPGQAVAQPFKQQAAAMMDAAAMPKASPQAPGQPVQQLEQACTRAAAQPSGHAATKLTQLQRLQQLRMLGRPKSASTAAQSPLSPIVPGLPHFTAVPAQQLPCATAASAAAQVAAQLAAAQPKMVNITWLAQAAQGQAAQGQAVGAPTGHVATLLPTQSAEPSAATAQVPGIAVAIHGTPDFTAQTTLYQPAAVGRAANASLPQPVKRARVMSAPIAVLEAQPQQHGGPAGSQTGQQQQQHDGESQTSAAAKNEHESANADGIDMLLAAAGIDVGDVQASSMMQHQMSPCKRGRPSAASEAVRICGSPAKTKSKAKASTRSNRKGRVRKPGAPSMAYGGVQVEKIGPARPSTLTPSLASIRQVEKKGPAQPSTLTPTLASIRQAIAMVRHETDQTQGWSPSNQTQPPPQQQLTGQDSVEEAAAVLTALKHALPDSSPIAVTDNITGTHLIHTALNTEAENFVAAAFAESPIKDFPESPMKDGQNGHMSPYGSTAASPFSAGSPGILVSRTGRPTPGKTVRFKLPGDVTRVIPVARQLLPATENSDPGPTDTVATMQAKPTGTQPTADASYPAQALSPGSAIRHVLNLRRASSWGEPDGKNTVLQQQQQSGEASSVGVSGVSGLGMASQLLLRHRQSLGLPVTSMERKTVNKAMCQLQFQQVACVPPASAMGLFIRTKLPSSTPAAAQQLQQAAAALTQQPKRQLVKLDLRRASEQDADDRLCTDGQGARPHC